MAVPRPSFLLICTLSRGIWAKEDVSRDRDILERLVAPGYIIRVAAWPLREFWECLWAFGRSTLMWWVRFSVGGRVFWMVACVPVPGVAVLISPLSPPVSVSGFSATP